jgi:hypothetical protein
MKVYLAGIPAVFTWMMVALMVGGASAHPPASPTGHRTYSTKFDRVENPLSDNGNWLNGGLDGVDWTNVRTRPGLAFSTESGKPGYDDSTALLAGGWAPDQSAQATVYCTNQNDKAYQEVELRLRSSLSPHKATGYEINFRCLKTEKSYSEIVRWDGPLNKFTYVKQTRGLGTGVQTGDVVKATIVGNVITVYVNGVQTIQGIDDTFKTGSPGIGFYLEGVTGVNADYGFSSFAASDGPEVP